MTTITGRDVLDRTKEIIHERWGQAHGYRPLPDGQSCLTIALREAAEALGGDDYLSVRNAHLDARCAVVRAIGDMNPLWFSLVGWNDTPGRTREEVEQICERAKRWLPEIPE